LAFPIINPVNRLLDRKGEEFNWGMSFSLRPFSRVNYFTSVDESLPKIGSVTREYRGSGGLNQFVFGNGVRYKNLSVGLGIGYMFGSIREERAVLFEPLRLASNNYQLNDASYRAFFWNGGIQYELDLSEGKGKEDARNVHAIRFGLAGHGAWNFRTVSTRLSTLKGISYGGLNDELPDEETDTIGYTDNLRLGGNMPGALSLGVVYRRGAKWVLGADFSTADWASYENELNSEAEVDELAGSHRFAIGAQFIPDAASFQYYWKRMLYRAGLSFGQDPRVINGNQIKNFSVNLGIALPVYLSRQLSFINLGLETGRLRGGIPIEENFLRFNIGVTLNNNLWFYKRKYN
jgi:hypothetical protein